MRLDCQIDGGAIACVLTSDRDLAAPVLCFSGMAPMTARAGGERISGCGSYTEVQLGNLTAGQPYALTLAYQDYAPANRAWLPLGPYLRTEDGPLPLTCDNGGPPLPDFSSVPDHPGLRLVPPPQDWQPSGEIVTVASFSGDHPAFDPVAALAERRGLGQFWSDDGLPVTCLDTDLPTDTYTLKIATDGIILSAGSPGGHLYGLITLLTLLQTHAGALPCGTITDGPRFDWRGQHLDCARHFYEVDTICDLLDLMALLKLNRFHWHFADDEAFRLEVDCLPDLWQQTRLRGEGQLMPALFAGDPVSGGSYSKADVARILAHASALNIEIMPEVEVPAHALALARVYPEVRDPDDTGTERSVQGYAENVMNPAMPRTWEVLEALVAEVGALFPFGHLHLGCDELPKETWMGSPAARALMQREGLATTDDLQGWTMARLARTVAAAGVRPAAWEEAARGANGGIGSDAILFSWTGQGPGLEAAASGYDVVMTPGQTCYMDMAHSADPGDWGATWAATFDLAETLNWVPVPQDRPDLAGRIIGVQGCFWSEFTTRDAQMWPMLVPRILGIATQAWSRALPDAADLTALAKHHQAVWPVG